MTTNAEREACHGKPLQHCSSSQPTCLYIDLTQLLRKQPAFYKSVMPVKLILHPEGKSSQLAIAWKALTGWNLLGEVDYHDFLSVEAVWRDEVK